MSIINALRFTATFLVFLFYAHQLYTSLKFRDDPENSLAKTLFETFSAIGTGGMVYILAAALASILPAFPAATTAFIKALVGVAIAVSGWKHSHAELMRFQVQPEKEYLINRHKNILIGVIAVLICDLL